MKKIKYIMLLFSFLIMGAQAQKTSFLTVFEMPNAVNYLPAPPDTASPRFFNDWYQYGWGKSLRLTPRGELARKDAVLTVDAISEDFSPAFGMQISGSNTPELYALLSKVIMDAGNATFLAKKHYMRKRPYMQFHEETLIPNDDEALSTNGSYPSGHTTIGWATALVLAEINPKQQDTILARGYEFGESRVIAGFHYQSDVDAGRLVASAAVARLHASEDFMLQLNKAKKEFLDKIQSQDDLTDGNTHRNKFGKKHKKLKKDLMATK
ncbi:MAG: phosphatase PAP2 family protein [Bacteroidaceae bacterium]|jgi:acid phosphatase (class A)|nr:phosphatase PAP2 family protein [Bacteroidaceae bacterium]